MKNKKIYKIPCAEWVKKTIDKMIRSDSIDAQSWASFWLETYHELGGKSQATGRKGCPWSAAYSLWRLGRIAGGEQPFRFLTTRQVKDEFGKNGAYAVIAAAMFEQSWISKTGDEIWNEVRRRFEKDTGASAAQTEQGAVRLAKILFEEGMIVPSGSA